MTTDEIKQALAKGRLGLAVTVRLPNRMAIKGVFSKRSTQSVAIVATDGHTYVGDPPKLTLIKMPDIKLKLKQGKPYKPTVRWRIRRASRRRAQP